ncbi:TonB-dependent receptor [Niveispirillum sp. BGYR6]|uniref:TonB-dependent receptor n=1 Tax=Niveispirillum sp. BGYR6 TaxID=2971249 RepID=UPI0022B99923|nr:TonB-dependent receptor [Niveispirillum sp. BGYR6]MDG5497348.1 TonB-dependent receptor [Niveispirillum sp. BGYR6]
MPRSFSYRSAARLGVSLFAVAIAVGMVPLASGQTASTVRGHVDGGAPGAVVTATNLSTGQKQTGKLDEKGDYVLVGLRPGSYRIEAAGNVADAAVPVGQTVIVDLAPAAPTLDEIVVTSARLTEPRSAIVSTNVTPAQIESLPQNDRNFLNFAALAPGVSVSPSAGNRSIQAGGVSADNINVFIDGTSYKNQVGHGGVAGQSFSQGNPFPQLAIQEFRVDTQNFKAEYEQAGSAIISAVTKTGGTAFHGTGFVQYQPKAFIGRPYFDRPGKANNPDGTREKPDYKRTQYGADLGGPIIAEKLHFYVAYEGTTQTNPSTGVQLLTPSGGGTPAYQALATRENGSFPADFKQDLLFGKLTFFVSEADTVDASYFLRKEDDLADFGNQAARSHGRLKQNDIKNYQLEWKHDGDGFLNEAQIAYQTVTTGTPRNSDGPETILTDGRNGREVAQLGGHFFTQESAQKLLTFKNATTWTGDAHTVKVGGKLTLAKFSRLEDFYSNGTYIYDANTYTGTAADIPYAAQIAIRPVEKARANNTQIGLFIQDDWEITDRLTANLGLRWDYESNQGNNKFVTPANVVTALRNYQGWKAAGINPDDYISTGKNRDAYLGAFQPRLGLSYDLEGDRKTVLFAGAGRYYDRNLFLTSQIETISTLYRTDQRIEFGGGTACAPAYQAGLKDPSNLRQALSGCIKGGSVWLLPNDIKLPYSDQLDIGVRQQFGEIQTSLTFAYVISKNIFQYVRGNRMPDGSFSPAGDLWIIDNFPAAGQLPGFNGKLNIGASEGEARYAAIYLTAQKPYTDESGWGFTTSLTLQRPRTNVGTELGADEFFEGPRQNQFGWHYVQGVDKYRFVGTGIVAGPWGTKLSSTLTLASGPAFGNVISGLPNTPPNACCFANLGGVFYPKTTFGYKNLDLRLSKDIETFSGHLLTLDFQVYNAFDWVNRSYSAWTAGAGANPTFKENGTVGNARTFQVGARYKF